MSAQTPTPAPATAPGAAAPSAHKGKTPAPTTKASASPRLPLTVLAALVLAAAVHLATLGQQVLASRWALGDLPGVSSPGGAGVALLVLAVALVGLAVLIAVRAAGPAGPVLPSRMLTWIAVVIAAVAWGPLIQGTSSLTAQILGDQLSGALAHPELISTPQVNGWYWLVGALVLLAAAAAVALLALPRQQKRR